MSYRSLVLMLILAVQFSGGVTWARTNDMKQVCVNCHTMHNSQNGFDVTPGGIGAQGALLNNSCYGCHTGDNLAGGRPVVLHSSAPAYQLTGTEPGHNTLAGGDFYWVAQGNDLKGHNVVGITGGGTLTCAGTTGCHGNSAVAGDLPAMYQTHHAVETAQPMDGAPLSESFRLLEGVAGYEDPDFELTVGSGDHNQYKGIARTAEGDSTASSISNFCARCHGSFHTGNNPSGISDDSAIFGTDPWIRHPVDYDMGGLGGEYGNYGSGGTYNIATPLGSADVSAIKSTVTLVTASGEAIVVCVSCHRAHGSPYDYSLRWDYKSWPDAGGYNGCGDCHTLKN